MVTWEDYLPTVTFGFNSDWTSTDKLFVSESQPIIGPPIRRLRSYMVLRTFNLSINMSYYNYKNVFVPFIRNTLHNGLDHFSIKDFTSSNIVEGYLVLSDGVPYSVKRLNDNLFQISLNMSLQIST